MDPWFARMYIVAAFFGIIKALLWVALLVIWALFQFFLSELHGFILVMKFATHRV